MNKTIQLEISYINKNDEETLMRITEEPDSGVTISLESYLQHCKNFAIALGYSPESVDSYFVEE